MKLIHALIPAMLLATPLAAQGLEGRTLSAELGLGASYKPTYPGSDQMETAPWFIWRNVSLSRGDGSAGDAQGFSVSPSFNYIGKRNEKDDKDLAGLPEVDRAYEIGARFSYTTGPVTGYAVVRKGFKGHKGVVGKLGATYRTDINDRLSLWSGVGVNMGSDDYVDTYFGVTPEAAASSGYRAYNPGGGVTSVSASLAARYAISDVTALVGELEYGRLVGDAADSPLTQDKNQPVVRLGITRRFSFGF
ncbi:MipA/OmpV family protein [Paracoccus pacificus]|uniref:MipA/OmpV family protein n=1 Tax=Paracoccus pacificus TaxID=1463598 RepID=A0ABW4R5A8_9RHOB